jgi:hypothetical protein
MNTEPPAPPLPDTPVFFIFNLFKLQFDPSSPSFRLRIGLKIFLVCHPNIHGFKQYDNKDPSAAKHRGPVPLCIFQFFTRLFFVLNIRYPEITKFVQI